jgi:uncharacterized membrane protein
MTKNEFLDGLRIALTGEIPNEDIESNIAFYDDYIKTKSSNNIESEVIEQLGDPRLIAKTIIETYQISHGPMYGHTRNERYQEAESSSNYSYSNDYDFKGDNNYDNTANDRSRRFNLNLTWYQKLIMIIIAVVLLFVIIIVGGILIQLFFTIGIPLLIVYLGYRLIVKGTKK